MPEKATRTWVLKTKAISNGIVTKYIATLRNEYKVSGDDFYYTENNPNPTLPIGTMTIQETKAPDGYLLDGAILSDNNGNTENIDNGVYLTQIKQDGSGGVAKVVAGNFPVVKDEVKKHHIEIEKVALDQEGNTTPLNDAEFTIKLKNDVTENGWDSAETYDVVTTANIDGKDGQAVTKDLPFGTYIARETVTPAGYVQADDFEFTNMILKPKLRLEMLSISFSMKRQIRKSVVTKLMMKVLLICTNLLAETAIMLRKLLLLMGMKSMILNFILILTVMVL